MTVSSSSLTLHHHASQRMMDLTSQSRTRTHYGVHNAPIAARRRRADLPLVGSRQSASVTTMETGSQNTSLEAAKLALLEEIGNECTLGFNSTSEKRGLISESQVALEAFGAPVDLNLLAGTWRLLYTSAPDVLSILQLQDFGFVRVDNIYQSFTLDGEAENIVKFSVPMLLQGSGSTGSGACLRVGATYNIRGTKTIALVFQEAKVGELRISELLETLLAPAVLPRMFGTMQLLQALRGLELKVPLDNSQSPTQTTSVSKQGIPYLLSYIDETMLVGRAEPGGGSFVFERAEDNV